MGTHVALVSFGSWSSVWENRLHHLADNVKKISLYRASNEPLNFDAPKNIEIIDIGPDRKTFFIPLYAVLATAQITYDQKLGEPDYDVIHSIDYYGGPVCAVFSSILAGIPCLVSMRGLPKQVTSSYLDKAKSGKRVDILIFVYFLLACYKYILPRADAFHFKSTSEKEYLERLSGEEFPESYIIPTGVDIQTFEKLADAPLDISSHLPTGAVESIVEDSTVLYAGRIEEGKGIEHLLSHHSSPDITTNLLIIGKVSGTAGEKISENIHEHADNHANIFYIPEFLPQKKIPPTIHAVDFVTLLTTFQNEGAPRIVQESLVLDTPCIVSNVSGIKEPFQDIEGCRVVNPKSKKEYQAALRSGGQEPVDVKEAKNRFNMRENYKKLASIYHNM